MSEPTDRRRTPTAHTLYGVLSRIQRGERDDPELLRKLDQAFSKHVPGLTRKVRRELRGSSAAVAEEVVQEVLTDAWSRLPEYQPDTEFRAFLWTLARNRCANVRRKRTDVLTEDGLVEAGSEEHAGLRRLADEQRNELFEEAARSVLDDRDQELVQLRWVLDYPLDEVASRLGLADVNEVRVGLQRCKRRLRTELTRLLAERGLGISFLRGG